MEGREEVTGIGLEAFLKAASSRGCALEKLDLEWSSGIRFEAPGLPVALAAATSLRRLALGDADALVLAQGLQRTNIEEFAGPQSQTSA